MMLRLFRSQRWVLFFALLNLPLQMALSELDAQLEREGASARNHIEASGTLACPAVHPEDCALCQVAQRIGTCSPLATSNPLVVREVALTERVAQRAPQFVAPSIQGSRAPPVV